MRFFDVAVLQDHVEHGSSSADCRVRCRASEAEARGQGWSLRCALISCCWKKMFTSLSFSFFLYNYKKLVVSGC